MFIYPIPKQVNIFHNYYESALPSYVNLSFLKDKLNIIEELKRFNPSIKITNDDNAMLFFAYDEKIASEGYKIEVLENQIKVYASKENGAFYAVETLKQIFEEEKIPQMVINDSPDLDVRGVMLDISRSKVPTLKTLKEIVDLLTKLKYNHLELYVEGFSFEYKHFKEEIETENNYITLKDYLELEKYCNSRYIDLVPNQNGFGHMASWLALDKYHHLSECPDGFFQWGSKRHPSTLDPTNPLSIEFVKKLYDDMLPYTKSKYFNMNFDEPFELGHGKSKSLTDKVGVEQVYIDYFKTLSDYVKTYHKIPMLWGDVLIKHPEYIKKLPKDIVFLDWGYNHLYDFNLHAKQLKEYNVDYLLAPGTVSWGNMVGNYQDMTGSILNSCNAAKQNDAKGVVITDWGDLGHLQYLPISIPGFIYGALNSWSHGSEDDLKIATSKIIGNDILAEVILDLSKYTLLEGEYRDYGSRIFSSILWAEASSRYDDMAPFYLEKMQFNLIEKENVLKLKDLFSKQLDKLNKLDDSLIVRELKNSIFLLQILLDINVKLTIIYTKQNNFEISFKEEISKLDEFSDQHLALWDSRNIHNGYKFSNQRILWLQKILSLVTEGKELQ